jgi:probable rRNA maturation factor
MSIEIAYDHATLPCNQFKLKRRLSRVITELGYPGYTLSILLTDDKNIKQLNYQYLKKDKSTNVLAFPDTVFPIGFPKYLGDLVVSTETIAREARAAGQDVGYLLYFYLIHGLLHLIGYDHEKGDKEEQEQEKETIRLMSLIKHDL